MSEQVKFEDTFLYLLSEGKYGTPPPPGWEMPETPSGSLDDDHDEWKLFLKQQEDRESDV